MLCVCPQVGCQCCGKLSYMLVLALLTFQALVLCPYGSACCRTTHDTLRLYGARVLSVLVSCTLPVVIARVLWPWWVPIASDCILSALPCLHVLYTVVDNQASSDLRVSAHSG